MLGERLTFSGISPCVGGSGPDGWSPPVPGSGVMTGDGDGVSSGDEVGVRDDADLEVGVADGCAAAALAPGPGLPSRAISAKDTVSPTTVNAPMPTPTATTSRLPGPRYLGVG